MATTTTTQVAQNKTVLVLNSYRGWWPALLIDSNGRQEKVDCFTRDENSEAFHSCSLVWNNQFYVYGGFYNGRQISKLNGNR